MGTEDVPGFRAGLRSSLKWSYWELAARDCRSLRFDTLGIPGGMGTSSTEEVDRLHAHMEELQRGVAKSRNGGESRLSHIISKLVSLRYTYAELADKRWTGITKSVLLALLSSKVHGSNYGADSQSAAPRLVSALGRHAKKRGETSLDPTGKSARATRSQAWYGLQPVKTFFR